MNTDNLSHYAEWYLQAPGRDPVPVKLADLHSIISSILDLEGLDEDLAQRTVWKVVDSTEALVTMFGHTHRYNLPTGSVLACVPMSLNPIEEPDTRDYEEE